MGIRSVGRRSNLRAGEDRRQGASPRHLRSVTDRIARNVLITAVAALFGCERTPSQPAVTNPMPNPIPNPKWSHEPAGFTPIEQQSWAGWGSWVYALQDGYMTLVSNQDGPVSPPSAIQFRQPSGMTGGGEPPWRLGLCWLNVPLTRFNKQVFLGVWFKVSPDFQGHASGVQKLYNVMSHAAGSSDLWLEVRGIGNDPLGVQVVMTFAGLNPMQISPNETNYAADPHPGETAVVISRGGWHQYELRAELPPISGGNGALQVWLDGTLAINRTDVPMSFDLLNGWVQLAHDPIWGGVGDTKQHDDYVWLDETYVSGP